MTSATKVLDIGLSQYVIWRCISPCEQTKPRAQLFKAKREIRPRTGFLGLLHTTTTEERIQAVVGPGGLYARGWNFRMVRALSPLKNAKDMATSGIPQGLETWRSLRHWSNRSFQKDTKFWARKPHPRAGKAVSGGRRNEDTAFWRPVLGSQHPRHFEFQKKGKIFIGIQAQKKGRQIYELWEVAGVGLWLLFAQAVGEQAEGQTHRSRN